MRRPDSNSSLLRLRRNKWLSANSVAGAETCHSGASAAEADSTVSPYVAAKAAAHKHSRPSPNILLIGTGVGAVLALCDISFDYKGRFDSDITGDQLRGGRSCGHVRLGCYWQVGLSWMLLASGFQFSQNGDSCLAQNTLDHVVGQARCVVVKMEEIFFLVIAEFLKAVSVGELAERAKMLRLESLLQFVGGSH